MQRVLVSAIAAMVVAASGCGSNGPPELASDYAPAFKGIWYAYATETDTLDDGSVTTSSGGVQLQINATGKNSLHLPDFCGTPDVGPDAAVTAENQFSMQAYTCPSTTGGCPSTLTVESGTGTLNGGTLDMSFRGHIHSGPGNLCQATTVRFQVTLSGSHDPLSAQPPPIQPKNLTVERGEYFGYYRLRWDGVHDDYTPSDEVQLRFGTGGEWKTVVFNSDGTVYVVQVPEHTLLTFRVRTSSAGRTSDFSNEASIDSGFTQPEVVTTSLLHGAFELFWRPRSDVEGLVISRAPAGSSDYVTLATVDPTSHSYLDTTAAENQAYQYLLHWTSDGVQGWDSTVYGVAPLLSPIDVVAVASAGRVDLSWTNRSPTATVVVILRGIGASDYPPPTQVISILPITATSYSDVNAPSGPLTYRVEVRAPSATFGGTSVYAIVPPPASAGSWNTQLVDLPPNTAEARFDSQERLVSRSLYGDLGRSDHPSWAPRSGVGSWALDASDRIHLVYAQRLPTDPQVTYAIVHEWLEGDVWQTEELTRGDLFVLAFVLDGTGHPVVAVTSGSADAVRVISWDGSGYRSEDPGLALPPARYLSSLWLAQSPDGVTHVLAQLETTAHSWRQGSWSSETVPVQPGNQYTPGVPAVSSVFARGGATLDLILFDYASSAVSQVSRDASSWGGPRTVFPAEPWKYGVLAAMAADGSDLAVLAYTPDGVEVGRLRDDWNPRTLLDYGAGLLGLSEDPDGHLVAILGVGATYWENHTQAVIYREQ